MYMLITYEFFWKASDACLFGSGLFVFVSLSLVSSTAHLTVFFRML